MLDRKKNIINLERTAISKIFDWFENDFTKEGSLKDFIQKYNNQLDSSNPIEYLKYDWGLNEFHK
jgi:malate synthase